MRLLVIGAGGREHALAWALARSPQAERIYAAPGNGGTAYSNTLTLAAGETIDLAVGRGQDNRLYGSGLSEHLYSMFNWFG